MYLSFLTQDYEIIFFEDAIFDNEDMIVIQKIYLCRILISLAVIIFSYAIIKQVYTFSFSYVLDIKCFIAPYIKSFNGKNLAKNAIFESMEVIQMIHELIMHSILYELTLDKMSLNDSLEY